MYAGNTEPGKHRYAAISTGLILIRLTLLNPRPVFFNRDSADPNVSARTSQGFRDVMRIYSFYYKVVRLVTVRVPLKI